MFAEGVAEVVPELNPLVRAVDREEKNTGPKLPVASSTSGTPAITVSWVKSARVRRGRFSLEKLNRNSLILLGLITEVSDCAITKPSLTKSSKLLPTRPSTKVWLPAKPVKASVSLRV